MSLPLSCQDRCLRRSAVRRAVLLVGAGAAIALPVAAQTARVAPTIRSVFPRVAAVGATITVLGSNLMVPGYRTEVWYQDRYGSGARKVLVPTGSPSQISFPAPEGLRPDSILIGLVDTTGSVGGGQTRAQVNNPLSSAIAIFPTSVFIPGRGLHLVQVIQSRNIEFGSTTAAAELTPGAARLMGRYLLQPGILKGSDFDPLAVMFGRSPATPAGSAPTVSFAGAAVPVQNARYIPNSSDELSVAVPNLPHNTSGFLVVAGPYGRDSIAMVLAQPPQIDRVIGTKNGVDYTVADGILLRGASYRIVGRNLRVTRLSGNIATQGTLSVSVGTLSLPYASNSSDTLLYVSVPPDGLTRMGPITVEHAGGTRTFGQFTVMAPPTPLAVTAVNAATSDVIGGTDVVLQVALTPTPTDFTRAGKLIISMSPSLAAAIPTPPPFDITNNPATLTIPTNAVSTTLTGSIFVRHETGTMVSSTTVTIRPPRPTAILTPTDTIPNTTSITGTITFDRPGPATVLLSSSDPSTVMVGASLTRPRGAATFTINTAAVTAPRPVTITAAINGVTATKTLVVRPGRPVSITPSVNPLLSGNSASLVVAFDAPVAGLSMTTSAPPASLNLFGQPYTVNGSSFSINASAKLGITTTDTVALSAITPMGTVVMGQPLIVRPNAIAAMSAGARTTVGGSQMGLTLRLDGAATDQLFVDFQSSDPSFPLTPASPTLFSIGESAKLVNLSVPATTSMRSVTVTARLHAFNNVNAPVISTKSLSFTVTP